MRRRFAGKMLQTLAWPAAPMALGIILVSALSQATKDEVVNPFDQRLSKALSAFDMTPNFKCTGLGDRSSWVRNNDLKMIFGNTLQIHTSPTRGAPTG